jgi:microcystin-dependent protein
MKQLLLVCFFIAKSHLVFVAQVGVNILTPHASSALQVESPQGSYKGLLTPSMTTTNRMSMTTGTNTVADGLVVYDITHRMHYYYQSAISRWVSMSPFTLSTPTVGSSSVPSGVITTPSSTAIFSVGINTQNPSQALDVTGNATVSGVIHVGIGVTTPNFSVNGFGINPLVPPGTIVMWHGNSIPVGWTECNGTQGTPDLRGRFIVASGQAASTTVPGDLNPSYSVNGTGGENNHILTKPETPRHHHLASGDGASIAANGGSHYHSVTPNGQGTGASRSNGNSGGLANDSQATIGTTSESHSHPNGEFSGQVGHGGSDGLNNQPHENRPQYYVLKFIMKT